jgi:hypothetical protein
MNQSDSPGVLGIVRPEDDCEVADSDGRRVISIFPCLPLSALSHNSRHPLTVEPPVQRPNFLEVLHSAKDEPPSRNASQKSNHLTLLECSQLSRCNSISQSDTLATVRRFLSPRIALPPPGSPIRWEPISPDVRPAKTDRQINE